MRFTLTFHRYFENVFLLFDMPLQKTSWNAVQMDVKKNIYFEQELNLEN